jgi:2-keto-4-pentenoate hydratase
MVGWKCGATNKAAQERLGLSEPFCGPLFSDMMTADASHPAFSIDELGIRGVEAEFGLHLAYDLGPREEPYKLNEVYEAVAGVSPVLEICCSR